MRTALNIGSIFCFILSIVATVFLSDRILWATTLILGWLFLMTDMILSNIYQTQQLIKEVKKK